MACSWGISLFVFFLLDRTCPWRGRLVRRRIGSFDDCVGHPLNSVRLGVYGAAKSLDGAEPTGVGGHNSFSRFAGLPSGRAQKLGGRIDLCVRKPDRLIASDLAIEPKLTQRSLVRVQARHAKRAGTRIAGLAVPTSTAFRSQLQDRNRATSIGIATVHHGFATIGHLCLRFFKLHALVVFFSWKVGFVRLRRVASWENCLPSRGSVYKNRAKSWKRVFGVVRTR